MSFLKFEKAEQENKTQQLELWNLHFPNCNNTKGADLAFCF